MGQKLVLYRGDWLHMIDICEFSSVQGCEISRCCGTWKTEQSHQKVTFLLHASLPIVSMYLSRRSSRVTVALGVRVSHWIHIAIEATASRDRDCESSSEYKAVKYRAAVGHGNRTIALKGRVSFAWMRVIFGCEDDPFHRQIQTGTDWHRRIEICESSFEYQGCEISCCCGTRKIDNRSSRVALGRGLPLVVKQILLRNGLYIKKKEAIEAAAS